MGRERATLQWCQGWRAILLRVQAPGTESKPFRVLELLLVLWPNCDGRVSDSARDFRFYIVKAGKMTKPHHKLKKANHGARPANAKARKAKRKKVRT